FAETAAAHAKVLGALTIADRTLASLRTWYWTYTRAIEAGTSVDGIDHEIMNNAKLYRINQGEIIK
ncbi:hypothetical protein J1N44_22805, partial [Acidovorax temperans]|nr:hypothetical protein [Acidovorax temperans]